MAFYAVLKSTLAALDLTGTKAARANIHLARRAVNYSIDALDVGRPGTLGLPVGVTHQITGHDALVAYFAKLTHALHLLTDTRHTVSIKQKYSTMQAISLQAKITSFGMRSLLLIYDFSVDDGIDDLCENVHGIAVKNGDIRIFLGFQTTHPV